MRVLVACEFSGRVRDVFGALGHDAWSCDVLPSDAGGKHLLGDVRRYLKQGWDLMIAHPPCTRLCNSGVRWYRKPPPGRSLRSIRREFVEGCQLFADVLGAPVERICVENPVMHGHATGRIARLSGLQIHDMKPTQTVQPWHFGDPETKRTCLWLKNLPPACASVCNVGGMSCGAWAACRGKA